MNSDSLAVAVTVGTVLVVAVLTSPAVGPVALAEPTDDIGDGSANVSVVSLDDAALRVAEGRFGTGVSYVRVPDAVVQVEGTDGRSRLVYRLEIPTLDIEATTTTPVPPGADGRYRLRIRDPAIDPSRVPSGRHEATLTVRVQSFTVDRTVAARNVTVEVGDSG